MGRQPSRAGLQGQGSSVGRVRNWTWSGSRTPHLRTPGSCPRSPGGSEGEPDPERPMDLQAAVRWTRPRVEGAGPGFRHHFIQKNLTGDAVSRRRGRVGVSCGAQKEHSILLSIVALGRTLRGAVAGGRRGALEKAAWTVAVRTEAVMRRHCRKLRQRSWRPETRPSRRPGGRRRLLLRALDAVATCWEKLFALRAAATDGSWGS
ncbi:uncharacterized protein C20orf204 homolog isoform X2 [Bubalus bubalis]|uniref:uncharacterized protein C20orf204 homolog isoform X2 n=1 Tax=Bubalus bubalis TaxID=89462 RepID=UPI000DBCA2A8|nr:uncharacterized protein C20orf204 homolog isoform X2 [Bubalus bubalis]